MLQQHTTHYTTRRIKISPAEDCFPLSFLMKSGAQASMNEREANIS